jgi:RHH-type proline utilization regulon transcriptional repressor/proline dehydrogenase/delta 1-pyrroline-5-carboxylate dehydrogenase
MGDVLESRHGPLVALLSREAGKTLNDGVAEVREAVDFCAITPCWPSASSAAPKPCRGRSVR